MVLDGCFHSAKALKKAGLLLLLVCTVCTAKTQQLMDMIDTTSDVGKSVLGNTYNRFFISGYLQPQYQVVQSKGARSFGGGDFPTNSNSRFTLRRGRLRLDYQHLNKKNQVALHFVFQFDGTERGFFTRDFWGRFFENKWQLFSFTTGIFARPFGYELNLGSGDRESPERGRMSQLLMRVERDLGAMISFEPRSEDNKLKFLKIDAGFFNGQGLNATTDYDSYKDFIARASFKKLPLNKKLSVTGGVSYFNGGLFQNTKYSYSIAHEASGKIFIVDSSLSNVGRKAPRQYYGADMQWKFKHVRGTTELRGEYWWGKQTASAGSSETPPALLNEPYYVRKFNGAFFYLLHHIDTKHQVGLKYDLYDPNSDISGNDIGKSGSNTTDADIKFSTFSVGYNYYINPHLKLMVWYDIINNEDTGLANYTGDIKDNLLTTRLQFRF
jgi:hypothetical protein